MGETGRMEATWQKMGIDRCGVAAPPIGEGFVDYALDYTTIWEKRVGRGQ
jgi:hypothetical protein